MQRPQTRGDFSVELVEERSGFLSFIVDGKNAKELFANEAGGHRWQRVPPTERRGRVQTSTITVAILDMVNDYDPKYELNMKDVDIATTRGSGPGGQHRNKTESCVVVTHEPTGIVIRLDSKSQNQNKQMALKILKSKLADLQQNRIQTTANLNRKEQVGSGMRGDKIRTYREKDDIVIDHRSDQKWSLNQWLRGNW
jgi:peptide chain release factor 1